MRFQPAHLELARDQRTALFLINRYDYQHSFDIDILNVHVTVPGQSSAITFVQPRESGQFHFYCGVAGHEVVGMVGSVRQISRCNAIRGEPYEARARIGVS